MNPLSFQPGPSRRLPSRTQHHQNPSNGFVVNDVVETRRRVTQPQGFGIRLQSHIEEAASSKPRSPDYIPIKPPPRPYGPQLGFPRHRNLGLYTRNPEIESIEEVAKALWDIENLLHVLPPPTKESRIKMTAAEVNIPEIDEIARMFNVKV